MSVNQLLLLLIFLLTSKTGFSAEISVFVQTGASVQLDIQTQQPPEFDLLVWTNNKSEGIVKYNHDSKKVTPLKDRVVFNDVTFTLTLKNMQKNDSGLYRARISGSINIDLVSYRVSVIDAVKAPVLTVNSNWSSSDSCTVNFTCRAHELMINSSYQNNRCSPQEVTSQIHTLILDCSEEYIICNHSNPVSWKQDRRNITRLCEDKDKNLKSIHSPLLGKAVGSGAVCIVLIFFILIVVYFKCKKVSDPAAAGPSSWPGESSDSEVDVTVRQECRKRTAGHASPFRNNVESLGASCCLGAGAQEEVEGNTVYAQVEAQEMQKPSSDFNPYDIPDRVQAETQEEMADKQPSTTYCTVGQHQKTPVHPETDHTIYSAVCKQQNKKPPVISTSDT